MRGEGLKLSMSQYLIGEIASKANIEVIPLANVVEAQGEDNLQRIVARVQPPGEKERWSPMMADALFVMIGAMANASWLPKQLERDEMGYICTGRELTTWKLGRAPFPLETSLQGFSAPAMYVITRSSAYPVESVREDGNRLHSSIFGA